MVNVRVNITWNHLGWQEDHKAREKEKRKEGSKQQKRKETKRKEKGSTAPSTS